jgi:hypothetical protein
MATTTATMATLKSRAVFGGRTMICGACVALPIPRLVRLEVGEWRRPALRHRSYITVVRIIAIINMAVESARAMKPRPSADEYPANEPIRPIVAIGSTGVRRIVKVPVRTHWRYANIHRDLSRGHGHAAHQCNSESRRSTKQLPSGHNVLLKPSLIRGCKRIASCVSGNDPSRHPRILTAGIPKDVGNHTLRISNKAHPNTIAP